MEQCIDEMNKIIYIKCTEEEKIKIQNEYASYQLYDYIINFIVIDETMDKNERKE